MSKGENPYQRNADGAAVTRKSVVAFLDVLGFTTQMSQAYENATDADLLRDLRSALTSARDKAFPDLYPTTTEYPPAYRYREQVEFWQVKAFTDNVIIGVPLSRPGDDAEGELGSLIQALCWYQLEMATRGFFVRGGIAIGDLYIDEDIVFGDALIEAHKIENEVARDPRIVLSPTLEPYIGIHFQYYGDPQESPHSQIWLEDADGQLFVNYLGITYDENPEEPDLAAIEAHRGKVMSMLDKHKASPTIWGKYAWVANYHNFICEERGGPFLPYTIKQSLLRLAAPKRIV
ncbi:MAG: hypothetical protein AABN34_16960 [Acidobacteriota bacterium]